MTREQIAAKAQAAGLALTPEQLDMAYQAVQQKMGTAHKQDFDPAPPPIDNSMGGVLRRYAQAYQGKVQPWVDGIAAGGGPGVQAIAGPINDLAGRLASEHQGGSMAGLAARVALPAAANLLPGPAPLKGAIGNVAGGMADRYLSGEPQSLMGSATDALVGAGVPAIAGRLKAPVMGKPLAQEMTDRSIPNPFAGLSSEAFDRVGGAALGPGRPIVTAPVGALAEKGGKYATPNVAQAGSAGAELLKRLAAQADEKAALATAGGRGAAQAEIAQGGLQARNAALVPARAQTQAAVREALPQRQVQGSPARIDVQPGAGDAPEFRPGGDVDIPRQDVTITPAVPPRLVPRGEQMVNKAQMEPNSFNPLREDTPATQNFWGALGREKSLGMEQKVLRGAKAEGMGNDIAAQAAGVAPEQAPGLTDDASALSGIARSLNRQRAGMAQDGSGRGAITNLLHRAGKVLVNPTSTLGGIRPESPESAIRSNSPRLVELERAARGMPAVDPLARTQAMSGMEIPLATKAAQGGINSGLDYDTDSLLKRWLDAQQ